MAGMEGRGTGGERWWRWRTAAGRVERLSLTGSRSVRRGFASVREWSLRPLFGRFVSGSRVCPASEVEILIPYVRSSSPLQARALHAAGDELRSPHSRNSSLACAHRRVGEAAGCARGNRQCCVPTPRSGSHLTAVSLLRADTALSCQVRYVV
jgi:hypothetical protein